MKARQQGFTLVELVVVIVILGILAATAIPRYASYTSQARIASLQAVQGAINSAVLVVQGRYIAGGQIVSPVTMLDGTTVAVLPGAVSAANIGGGQPLASAAGIGNAVQTQGTFLVTAGGLFTFNPAIANCNLQYNAPTAAANYTTTLTTGGC